MAGYAKLFSSIVHSTIWREPMPTRVVWITMLALADKNGRVEASIPGLADVSRVTITECEDALFTLRQPDPYSRSKEFEGRRIEQIDGGWLVLNYSKYRDLLRAEEKREQGAERQRRHRRKKAGLPVDGGPCAYCGNDATGPDYIIPKARGGVDVVLCCPDCNNLKASMSVVDFLNIHKSRVQLDRILQDPILKKYVTHNGQQYVGVTNMSHTGNTGVTDPSSDPTTDPTLPTNMVGVDLTSVHIEQKYKHQGVVEPNNVGQSLIKYIVDTFENWPQDQVEACVGKLRLTDPDIEMDTWRLIITEAWKESSNTDTPRMYQQTVCRKINWWRAKQRRQGQKPSYNNERVVPGSQSDWANYWVPHGMGRPWGTKNAREALEHYRRTNEMGNADQWEKWEREIERHERNESKK